ncbi:MAG: ABC transporter substrate-binding protein [Bacteriovoracaceae bacterium]|jgi:microcin C transport system substrate-binding protein|nr:ABC transporter substrate-binding protein [Bacteriovoracaceae bacterium]
MNLRFTFLALILIFSFSCNKETKKVEKVSQADDSSSELYQISKTPLPSNLNWESNLTDPIYSSPNAVKGGSYNSFIDSFPLTLRVVGPDSNGGFAGVIRALQLSPTDYHPNTRKPIPILATEWAHSKDLTTIYYKLNKKAKWSDGKPLRVDDFIFALEMYKSKHIVAPWYNEYYTKNFAKIIKYDEHTMAVVGKNPKSSEDLHYYYGLGAFPKHFYNLSKNFVKDYNWKIPPTLAPYQIDVVKKGKYLTLKRVKNWWGENERFFKNRFNVDKIKYTVIRDQNVAFEHFKKGELESFGLTLPDFWHNKAKGKIFDSGYVHKLWFYTKSPQPEMGMWMNLDREIFKDINTRKGFSHAMNVDKVLKTVLRNDYERQHNAATGYGKYSNESIKARKFDLKKAGSYLKKAGWEKRGADGIRVKNGKRFSVKVLYGAKHHNDRLVVLKEEAKKAGIELELKLMDGSTAFKAMQEKQHDVAHSGWGAMWKPQYWGQYHSANASKPQTNNFSNTNDKELDKYIDGYRLEFDSKKKAKLSRQIQQRIHDLSVVVPTYLIPYFRQAYWRWIRLPKDIATEVSDSATDPLGLTTGGLFWVDKKLKSETKEAMKNKVRFKPETIIEKKYKTKS